MKYYITLAFLYLQAAVFTGAWRAYNVIDDSFARGVADLYAGLFWPLYWNIKLAMWVVQ